MQRLRSRLLVRSLLERSRGFCTSSDKIVASVLFERLRVVIPKPDPAVYTFQEFKSNWQQQFRRRYPDEFLDIAKNRCLITEPRVNTKWTIYLLLELQRLTRTRIGSKLLAPLNRHGLLCSLSPVIDVFTLGKCSTITGHYIELLTKNCTFSSSANHLELLVTNLSGISQKKVYDSEPTLRKCAESALKSVLGDLTHTYFVGNAPMAHMVLQPTEETPGLPSYKRFFFKCSVVAASKYNISNCQDFVWVTKDELLEFFPEQAEFFNKMIIS